MKLFSRKAIAAVAASVALTTAGLSAPAFAQSSETTTATATTTTPAPAPALSSEKEDGEENGDLSSDPDQMKSWIGVFTAIISALSAGLLFIQRING